MASSRGASAQFERLCCRRNGRSRRSLFASLVLVWPKPLWPEVGGAHCERAHVCFVLPLEPFSPILARIYLAERSN